MHSASATVPLSLFRSAARASYLIGNPVVIWLLIPVIVISALLLVLWQRYRHEPAYGLARYSRFFRSVMWCLALYTLNLLPYVAVKRSCFIYHYSESESLLHHDDGPVAVQWACPKCSTTARHRAFCRSATPVFPSVFPCAPDVDILYLHVSVFVLPSIRLSLRPVSPCSACHDVCAGAGGLAGGAAGRAALPRRPQLHPHGCGGRLPLLCPLDVRICTDERGARAPSLAAALELREARRSHSLFSISILVVTVVKWDCSTGWRQPALLRAGTAPTRSFAVRTGNLNPCFTLASSISGCNQVKACTWKLKVGESRLHTRQKLHSTPWHCQSDAGGTFFTSKYRSRMSSK